MKKYLSNIRTLAALLMAGTAFAACSSDDGSIDQPANPTAPKTYTLTVNATKEGASRDQSRACTSFGEAQPSLGEAKEGAQPSLGEAKDASAATRALELDGEKLVAKWATGDKVYVYKATNRAECTSELGTISPVAGTISADGAKATFTGTLAGTVSTGDKLMLVYHPAAFAITGFEGQDGTLASASALDCATALVTASVSGSDITISETSATFTTHTAMLKLTLQDNAATPNKLKANSLKMALSSVGDYLYFSNTFSPEAATYTANGDGVLYFALPSAEDVASGLSALLFETVTTSQLAGTTITYTATVGTDDYVATRTGYTFAAGSYYAGTLTMAKAQQVIWNSTNVFNDSNEGVFLASTALDHLTYEGITISGVFNNGNTQFWPYSLSTGYLLCSGDKGESFTFTAPEGKKFTKIVIISNSGYTLGDNNWSKYDNNTVVWSGTAYNTVTLGGSGESKFEDLNSIIFTLE